MGSIGRKNYQLLIWIGCIALCLACLCGCKSAGKEENTILTATTEETKTNDETVMDACSRAVKELIQKPYYHLVLTSDNDSIQTQIYCDGENYLMSDYDGELRLASAMKYDGIYAVEEKGKYVIVKEDQAVYADYIIQTYDILDKSNLKIQTIEYASDRVIRIDAEWDERDNGVATHIQGNFAYEFLDNGDLSSVQVEKWQTDELPTEHYFYSLVIPNDTQEAIKNIIYKASQQITVPSQTTSEPENDLIAPPSNRTDYDRNFLLGSDEMKWSFFNDSWFFALREENQTPEGITLVHNPASETKDVILEHGQEYFLESWDGKCWSLIYRGTIPSESSEENLVFSGDSIMEPVSVQINWSAQYGALKEGKYRVGMYYTAIRSSGEQETNLCYAKFLVSNLENDSLIKKCESALGEILASDTYHIQRTDYMSQQRDKEDSYYYVSDIWRSGQNYYEEVTYYYNSTGETRSALGMLLRDGKGYSWNTLNPPDKFWSESDDLTERSFQLWTLGLECTDKTLENIIQKEDSIAFEFPYASGFSGRDKIQGNVITYYFNRNDELVRVTLEHIGDNQEKVLETELLVQNVLSESAEAIIREQNVAVTPAN